MGTNDHQIQFVAKQTYDLQHSKAILTVMTVVAIAARITVAYCHSVLILRPPLSETSVIILPL